MWHFSCGFTTRGMMKSTWWKDAFWKCIVSLNSIKTWSRAYIVFAWHGLVINSLFSFLLVDNDNFKMLWSRWKLQSHVFLYNLSCRRNKKFSKSTRTVAYKSVKKKKSHKFPWEFISLSIYKYVFNQKDCMIPMEWLNAFKLILLNKRGPATSC